VLTLQLPAPGAPLLRGSLSVALCVAAGHHVWLVAPAPPARSHGPARCPVSPACVLLRRGLVAVRPSAGMGTWGLTLLRKTYGELVEHGGMFLPSRRSPAAWDLTLRALLRPSPKSDEEVEQLILNAHSTASAYPPWLPPRPAAAGRHGLDGFRWIHRERPGRRAKGAVECREGGRS